MSASGSPLTLFTNTLVRFFEELKDTFPEEREIRVALETIQNAKKINPGLVRDMFYEHVTGPLREAILREDVEYIVSYGRTKLLSQFNEISPAFTIFDKHWSVLSDANRQIIWKYMKALIVLNEKAKQAKSPF